MQLSDRLSAVAGLIREGKRLADVGTDHGYIPIYLVQRGICESAIALDIKQGPLERAREHICQYGLEEKISVRLSDGVSRLFAGEADCMVVAGMGGALTIHILEDGKEIVSEMKEWVLQPQSEIGKVRKYLWEHDFTIVEEDMVFEDGKYYPMMRVVPREKRTSPDKTESSEWYELFAQYGKFLLEHRHPVLRQYLEREKRNCENVLDKLKNESPDSVERIQEFEKKDKLIKCALQMY